MSGGCVFGELSYLTYPEGTGLGITPRIVCWDDFSSLNVYCSLGGTVDYSGTTDENDVKNGLSQDAERSESVSYVCGCHGLQLTGDRKDDDRLGRIAKQYGQEILETGIPDVSISE